MMVAAFVDATGTPRLFCGCVVHRRCELVDGITGAEVRPEAKGLDIRRRFPVVFQVPGIVSIPVLQYLIKKDEHILSRPLGLPQLTDQT